MRILQPSLRVLKVYTLVYIRLYVYACVYFVFLDMHATFSPWFYFRHDNDIWNVSYESCGDLCRASAVRSVASSLPEGIPTISMKNMKSD